MVRGDADNARWEIDVRAVVVDDLVDLRGPAVHGKKGERFLNLTWGDVGAGDSFAMFRRAKLDDRGHRAGDARGCNTRRSCTRCIGVGRDYGRGWCGDHATVAVRS